MYNDVNFHDYFYYDETSPSCLRWKINRYKGKDYKQLHISSGSPAGNWNAKDPYFVVSLDHVKYSVHKVIWRMLKSPIPDGYRIDHFDQATKNNRIDNLRCIPFEMNSRNCSMASHNTSGVTGVTRKNDIKYPGWRATWMGTNGRRQEKFFAVLKHGEDGAFKLACAYREEVIRSLNKLGYGYTEMHGVSQRPKETNSSHPSSYSPNLAELYLEPYPTEEMHLQQQASPQQLFF